MGNHKNPSVGTMKKKAKGKKKATRKKSKKAAEPKELNPAQVLKNISALVKAEAQEITKAVIGEGKKGQLSPAKYLFEMAHIYPQPVELVDVSKEEESFAETLLDRLKIPKHPVVHDELQKDDEEDLM